MTSYYVLNAYSVLGIVVRTLHQLRLTVVLKHYNYLFFMQEVETKEIVKYETQIETQICLQNEFA